MRKIKNPFTKRSATQGVTAFMCADNNTDIICPPGYVSLSNNEEIRRCVFKIADLVSNMTIMLMENGDNGDVRLKNELAKKIDVSPNKNMTRKNFVTKIVTDMLLFGNSVLIPEMSGDFIGNLSFAKSSSYESNGTSYRIRADNKIYEPDEVLHFVLNPDDDEPYKGTGYKDLVLQTVKNLLQANETKRRFLQSKWKPSLIISINSDAEELMDADKRAKILGSYTKTTEVGEPWLIPAGEIDIKTVQPLTLNDLAIQDSITLDIKVIAACLGIPAFMVGVGTFNKDEYNNFISTTIMSIAIIIQQELTKKLLISPRMYFKFSAKSLMQYNLTEQIGFVNEMVQGGMLSKNEGRGEFNYSPVDAEGMNDYTVLENYIKVSDLTKQKKLQQEGGV